VITVNTIKDELRSRPELAELSATVIDALARAVMRFVQARATTGTWGDLPGPHHHRAAAVWFQSVNRRLERSSGSHVT
jgi:hypothetical protein